jgi:hypothetical protein
VCLAVLLALDVVLRVGVDREFPPWQDRVPPSRVQWDPLILNRFIADMRRFPGRKIAVLGDSVMAAFELPYWATTPGRLAQRWAREDPRLPTRVYDLAMDDSRPGDELAVLIDVLSAHPDIVVIEMNIQMFSRAQAEAKPFAYPYLHLVVQRLEAYRSAARRLGLPETDPRVAAATRSAQQAWALYRYRELLDGILIGGAPLERVRGTPPQPIDATREPTAIPSWAAQPWYERRDEAYFHARMGRAYVGTPFDEYPNPSLFFAEQMVEYLNGHRVRAVVFLTPVNHALMDTLITPAEYAAHLRRLDRIFAGQSFVYFNAQDALADRFFLDDDHLTTTGHVRLAGLLYRAMRQYRTAASR